MTTDLMRIALLEGVQLAARRDREADDNDAGKQGRYRRRQKQRLARPIQRTSWAATTGPTIAPARPTPRLQPTPVARISVG